MNPLNLLTKGRTIRGFKKHHHTYSLTNMGVAPNFSAGRAKPPTPPHAEEKVSQSTLFDRPQRPASAPAMRPPAVATLASASSSPQPQPTPQARSPLPEMPEFKPLWDAATLRGAWKKAAEHCAGLLRRWNGQRKASPFQGSTVQTELELEKVVVVRNDLSEDDLELVPVAKKVKVKEKPAQHEQCQVTSTDR